MVNPSTQVQSSSDPQRRHVHIFEVHYLYAWHSMVQPRVEQIDIVETPSSDISELKCN
jgi:hypothetical protein